MEEWTIEEMMLAQFTLSELMPNEYPQIGEMFTSAKSKVSGQLAEVVRNRTGSFRLRLIVNGQERWTTATADYLKSGEWK